MGEGPGGNMDVTEQYKPCPLCGGNPEFEYNNNDEGGGVVKCQGCGIEVGSAHVIFAEEEWNEVMGKASDRMAKATALIDRLEGEMQKADENAEGCPGCGSYSITHNAGCNWEATFAAVKEWREGK